jgi:hypothetical protein
MRALRRLQAEPAALTPNGCSSCFYYQQMLPGAGYYDFSPEQPPVGLSEKQQQNWLTAKIERAQGTENVDCSPLRIYANSGFACNLSCTMCHQVPRRSENKRQILADNILAWQDSLEKCIEMCVIGGEPFTLPEAFKFIRKFIANPSFDPVRLSVFTNGTVLHKHWDLLRQKRLLNLSVSLDSYGAGYEKIRLGGKWSEVEANLLKAMEIKSKDHPDWAIMTTANIQKAGVPYLADYARWHVKNGIRTFLYDFITAPGVEDTFHTDNILHNPQVLHDLPRWRDAFDEASEIFRSVGWGSEAGLLDQYRSRVEAAVASNTEKFDRMRRQRARNDWMAQSHNNGSPNWAISLDASPRRPGDSVPLKKTDGLISFAETRLGDHMATPFLKIAVGEQGGLVRLRATWPKEAVANPFNRLAHIVQQSDQFIEVETFREYLDFGFGKEVVLTASIPSGTQAIRAVLTPLGEDETVLPRELTFDLDPETRRIPDTDSIDQKKKRARPFKLVRQTRKKLTKWILGLQAGTG